MVSRQCILAMELKDIGREKIDGSLAKHQIRQYFPLSVNCAIWYIVSPATMSPCVCPSVCYYLTDQPRGSETLF